MQRAARAGGRAGALMGIGGGWREAEWGGRGILRDKKKNEVSDTGLLLLCDGGGVGGGGTLGVLLSSRPGRCATLYGAGFVS